MKIGSTIRNLRCQKKMTIKELAEKTQVTSSFISQVERDLASPSLNTLYAIAEAMEVNITSFLVEESNRSQVVRREQRGTIHWNGKTADSLINKNLGAPFMVFHSQMEPGEEMRVEEDFLHVGTEFLTVISGKVSLSFGGTTHRLGPGDSICYDANLSHVSRATSDSKAELLIVVSHYQLRDY